MSSRPPWRYALDVLQIWSLTKVRVTLSLGWRNGSPRAEEGANPAADRRHRVPVVRRPGVREGERGRDRPRGPGGRGDGVQLLPEQGGPVLLAAGGVRHPDDRGGQRPGARRAGHRRVRPRAYGG